MSDARQNLSDALANAKARQAQANTKAPSKPKAAPKPPPRKTPARTTSTAPKPAKKAPKKKAKPKRKKSGGGSAFLKNFQSFTNTVIDELKHATSEISPGALISQATDGLKSIRKAVGLDEDAVPPAPESKSAAGETEPADAEGTPQSASEMTRAASQLPNADHVPSAASPQPAQAQPAKTTSPAKVKRAASKRKRPEVEETEVEHTDSDVISAEVFEQVLEAGAGDSPEQDVEEAPAAPPAKVQRAAGKKKQEESDEEAPSEPPEETNAVSQPAEEQSSEPAPEPQTEAHEPEKDPGAPGGESVETPAPKKPAPKAQGTVVSKAEHAVRGFRALQMILTNPIWAPIILDPKSRPSALYAPRERFDAQFADPVFREGLKAASRLASSYAFDPEKMLFNEQTIERVKSLNLDPNGKIKPHTENITSVIDKKTVEAVIELLKDGKVKHLLYSVGTRLGMFVPTIESLARIYLGLRKKEQLSSGDRLKLQEEILMRYRKAPYTEKMGKKARNLALNYFMDYLAEYGLKLYHDRFKDAPEGQDNPTAQYRRHKTIITFCYDMIEEWAKRVALSTQAIETIKAKFSENATHFLRETIGEPPPDAP